MTTRERTLWTSSHRYHTSLQGLCSRADPLREHAPGTPTRLVDDAREGTAVPVKFETAQREIESSADRNAIRVTCYIGKCRELAMHLAGQPLELLVSFKLRLRRLQPSLDTEIEQISTKIKQTLLLVL